MKKILVSIYFLILIHFFIISEESENLIDIFKSNFEKASPSVKYEVLQDAVKMGVEEIGPLFYNSIVYVINNANKLESEPVLRKIGQYAVTQIHRIKYTPAKDLLWKLFLIDNNTQTRVNVLIAIAEIDANSGEIINNINKWLDSQNNITLTGKKPDIGVIIACLQALGKIGDPSSFYSIFNTMIMNYSTIVTVTAEQALDLINGDLSELYMKLIMEGTFSIRKAAIEKSRTQNRLNDAEKCKIAHFTLNISLYSSPANQNDKEISRETRSIAADILSNKSCPDTSQLVIKHFNQAIFEMDRGIISKSYLLSAIEALGNMRTHDAAKRLTLYLETINSFTENGRVYDEQIVLAVLNSLKKLKDRVAERALIYTKYLDYSKIIKKAAIDALQNVQ